MASYAVMQPYFFPYKNYFRLIRDVDNFVIFDNAQFPRRGRVHRCELEVSGGKWRWSTLHVEKSPQNTQIRDIYLRPSAIAEWLHDVENSNFYVNTAILACLTDYPRSNRLLDLLEAHLESVALLLGLKANFVRASSVLERKGLSAEEYIIRLGQILGTNQYLNLSGGKALYSEANFFESGISIGFQEPSSTHERSILQALNLET